MNSRQNSNAIKMQKLRRAVDRLRNLNTASTPVKEKRQSWLARLRARLGLRFAGRGSEQSR